MINSKKHNNEQDNKKIKENGTVKTKKNLNKAKTSYDKLKEFIGDEIENMTIISARSDKKAPSGAWKKYKKTNKKAKTTKGNIGAIFRNNDKHKYAFLDIDGFKKGEKEERFYLSTEENIKFKEDLLTIFKNYPAIYEHSVLQRTQSGGYHLIFKHEEKKSNLGNEFMNSFKIPNEIKKKYNIPLDNLGTGSESGAIELFLNFSGSGKCIILAPSQYGTGKKYEIVHAGNKFGKPIKNVENQIKKAMKQAGYKYKATKQSENEKEVKKSKKTKEIIRDDEKVKKFIEDTTVFNLMVEEFKNQTGNHNRILGHYTSILLAIGLNEEETKKYMQKILDRAGNNTPEHRKQINDYIKRNNGTKPNYSKHLKNKELIKYLNSYFIKKTDKKTDKKSITYFLDISTKGTWDSKKHKEILDSLKVLPFDINLNENNKEDNEILEEIEILESILSDYNEESDVKKEFVEELQEKIRVRNERYHFKHDKHVQDLFLCELINYEKNNENTNNLIIIIYIIVQKILDNNDEAFKYMLKLLEKCESSIKTNKNTILSRRDNIEYSKININTYFKSTELITILNGYLERTELYNLINELLSAPNKTKMRSKLAKILEEKLNVVRRQNIGDTYILDSETNSYIKITNDNLFLTTTYYIRHKYVIGDDDIEEAKKFLSKRIKPSFNLVKLNNCLIDMNTVEKVEPDKPVLCLLDLPYDYNPEAQSEVVDNYLWGSLYDTDDETTQKKIQGVYELLGYLLTSGNKEEIILFLVGKKGGGKSVMGQIITALVGGGQNTCDVKLDEIGGNNQHATAPFIDAHLNLVQEQDKKPIKNTGAIKQTSGNDYMMVNPKFKPQVLLEPEEVPKTVVMCNNMPDLTQDTALIDRVITIQFKKRFRNTDEQIKDLGKLITEDKEAMEYIVFNSLQAYKPIAQGEKELTLREDEEIRIETINKNAEPIRFYLEQYVELDEDKDIFDPDYSVGYNDVAIPDLKQLIKLDSDKDGVQVDTGKDGLPEARKFKKIFCEIFDIDDKNYFDSKGFSREGKMIKYYNHLKFKEGVKNKLKEANNEKNTRIKEEITDKCIVNKNNAKILINLYGTMYNYPPMTFEEINKEYPYSKDYNDEGEVLLLRKLFKEFVKKGLIKEIKDNKIIKYSIDSNKLNNVYCNVKITDNNIKHLDIKTSVNIKSLGQYKIGNKVELPIPQVHLLLINNKCLMG